MSKSFIATGLLLAAVCFQQPVAAELTVGSTAPKLEVQKFIKGQPVKQFEPGKIYVVELWATWCEPCRMMIPHLTELQSKYKDVRFISVAVLEDNPKAVTAFVEEMGDKMDYRVALDLIPEGSDANEGKTVKNWMEAAELPGIPFAFIINTEGKVAWIGSPFELDEPIDQVVNGKWDLNGEIKRVAAKNALKKKIAEINKQLQKLLDQFNDSPDGNPDELITAVNAAAKEVPDQATDLQLFGFQVLSRAKNRADEAVALGKQLLESSKAEDMTFLDNMAWVIVNPDRETKADSKLIKFALTVAIKADKLAKHENVSITETLAKAYFDNGDFANAVKTQETCLTLAANMGVVDDTPIRKRLNQFKRALELSKTKSN